jgi:hypothetical protein
VRYLDNYWNESDATWWPLPAKSQDNIGFGIFIKLVDLYVLKRDLFGYVCWKSSVNSHYLFSLLSSGEDAKIAKDLWFVRPETDACLYQSIGPNTSLILEHTEYLLQLWEKYGATHAHFT